MSHGLLGGRAEPSQLGPVVHRWCALVSPPMGPILARLCARNRASGPLIPVITAPRSRSETAHFRHGLAANGESIDMGSPGNRNSS